MAARGTWHDSASSDDDGMRQVVNLTKRGFELPVYFVITHYFQELIA